MMPLAATGVKELYQTEEERAGEWAKAWVKAWDYAPFVKSLCL